ncbi:MAG: hypothetical protein RMH77_06300 [Sulfolobales archaeon]|nr:hypothetical protein [Sulfolobales archaeon]MCX8185526.1 hypothetical protein [Sulfolobales archaeon]MDW7969995.1 hypothetical protein [Sulfolobales archaeon]
MVKLVGTNSAGHLGWVVKYCSICNRKLVVGNDAIYSCPKCSSVSNLHYCLADYKRLHGKCPHCKSDLVPI